LWKNLLFALTQTFHHTPLTKPSTQQQTQQKQNNKNSYVVSQPYDLERSIADASPGTPILALLSPGVDVAGSVEALGARLGFTAESGRYASVALGQGQEPIAMAALAAVHKAGGWVLLQNIHLTIDWTSGPLDKAMDKLAEGAHPDFRLFLSAEPPPALERPLPIGILQASVKLTNEPPEGLKPNLKRACAAFTEDMLEACAKQAEFRTIIFALCYFHAALLERKKFGVGNSPGATSGIGWVRSCLALFVVLPLLCFFCMR
jgi:dynein heavy chain